MKRLESLGLGVPPSILDTVSQARYNLPLEIR